MEAKLLLFTNGRHIIYSIVDAKIDILQKYIKKALE